MSLIQASALNIPLAAGCVQCVATSPPYWGLRKYEGAQTFEWPEVQYAPMAGLPPLTVPAMRCELGLEPTPEAYIGHLVAVFREVRRVLREDGTVWLNLGDSYGHGTDAERKRSETSTKISDEQHEAQGSRHGGMAKQLIGIPWRAAFALQADGWWLRSDVIWAKKNCMPESVTDRPTKSHEYVFLLARSERYFYDAEAVREPHARLWDATNGGNLADIGHKKAGILENRDTHPKGYPLPNPAGRNRRTVWHIATQPFAGAHFAVWPPALVEPMVKAGTSERGCCPVCGAGWVRVVERTPMVIERSQRPQLMGEYGRTQPSGTMVAPAQSETIGWRPSCACGREDTVPALVLDPFNGSGTTGVVARNLGRRYVGLDVGYTYLHDIARPRMSTEFGREPVATAAEVAPLETLPLFAGGGT